MLICGDCLTELSKIEAASVDLVIADLPYGTTRNAWDSIIPLAPLWVELKRITKITSAIVMTAQQPFTATLVASNPKMFRFEMIWEKSLATGFLNAKKMPLKSHENILVFYRRLPIYNPQMGVGRPYRTTQGTMSPNYGRMDPKHVTLNTGTRYPRSVLRYDNERGHHPTQKPVTLLSYLVRTFSNPGDTILDPAMGSGSTGVAAVTANRAFVGIERDDRYFATAKARIDAARA